MSPTKPAASPHPYIPATPADRAKMLARVGVDSVEDLFADLPDDLRNPAIDLLPSLTEPELVTLLGRLADQNRAPTEPNFLGAGAYRRYIPSITDRLVFRSEYATSYTPYQPEISQGTLQSTFEYQSVVCELTGMDVSNAGLYDVATSTAEACLLATRVTKRKTVALLEPIHPGTAGVVGTYAHGAGIEVDLVAGVDEIGEEHACLVAQQPDFLGTIVDLEPMAQAAHRVGALLVAVADPFALGMLRSPGEAGADIVTGEGRDLAGTPAFGGPSVGLFAARKKYLRQMPGRIVGQTKELSAPPHSESGPRTGYVLTLQAREQFIRRERATSNVSTAQSLIALAFTITMQTLGPVGLRESAELCYQKAHHAASRIQALSGYEIPERGPWFQEFLVRGPIPAPELAARLSERGIVAGLDVSERAEPEARDALLFAVTETTPEAHVDVLIDALAEIGGSR
ncbi:MAG: aminomethyl-transferring glycine dehydrogenase subunit GcvPA [bacterium]|nr:aminomethyl-transferring glycine dehydrogenase subunit GcvPA [bacterium]MCY3651542.1 aminomethyl-transferring glycine dehydrogenase subunit GcvPA [bacterium]MDE0642582.1 aminomethyl-transferring glycine dehydrogenase subunit GcvPA [bacterium]MYD05225.1 aminomethyl-transferring glycine dehydrogenase subunit GcvPA [Acidimicrobiia bacterium]MYH54798.1 aminomethyl-transferring glycine dehydrogenase subunit GcvPA [Acidimicrobiia bacterium]